MNPTMADSADALDCYEDTLDVIERHQKTIDSFDFISWGFSEVKRRIRVLEGIVKGPYAPGQERKLKADFIKGQGVFSDFSVWFAIESEETVPGFPDVVGFYGSIYWLIELKVSDSNGVITFQKSQPGFYKKYQELHVDVVAWDVPGNRLVLISTEEIIASKSLRFKIPKDIDTY